MTAVKNIYAPMMEILDLIHELISQGRDQNDLCESELQEFSGLMIKSQDEHRQYDCILYGDKDVKIPKMFADYLLTKDLEIRINKGEKILEELSNSIIRYYEPKIDSLIQKERIKRAAGLEDAIGDYKHDLYREMGIEVGISRDTSEE